MNGPSRGWDAATRSPDKHALVVFHHSGFFCERQPLGATRCPASPTSGEVSIACDPRVLSKFLRSGGNNVHRTGWWRSNYSQPMQDCRIHLLQAVAGNPKAILAVKDTQGFARVKTLP